MISTPQVEGFDEVYKRNYTRLSQYAFHIIHLKLRTLFWRQNQP